MSIEKLLQYKILDIELKRIFLAISVLIAFYIIRYIFSNFLLPFLKKITKKTKMTFDDEIINIIEPPLRFLIIFLGFFAFIKILTNSSKIDYFLGKSLRTLIIIDFFWMLYRAEHIFTLSIEKIFRKKNLTTALGFVPFFNKVIKFIIIIFAFMITVQEWGYNIGALITGLGIGGVAIALAAKDTVANFFGSLMILLDNPFKIGDWIETPQGEGVVEDIGFRSTKIRTFAQALLSIPNSTLATIPITNWSKMGKRRITYKLGIKYSTPIDNIKKCINEIREMLINHPEIHQETIFVYLNEFADSSINLFLYFFTKTINWKKYLEVREDVNFKIMEILAKNKVEFAFPSTSLYIEEQPIKIKQEEE